MSVCLYTFSHLNISATSGPIVTKFYLNHHRGGGKAALGFGPDLPRPLSNNLWIIPSQKVDWDRVTFSIRKY